MFKCHICKQILCLSVKILFSFFFHNAEGATHRFSQVTSAWNISWVYGEALTIHSCKWNEGISVLKYWGSVSVSLFVMHGCNFSEAIQKYNFTKTYYKALPWNCNEEIGEKTLMLYLPINLNSVISTMGLKTKNLSVRTPWNLSNQRDQRALGKTLFDPKKLCNSDKKKEPELRWERKSSFQHSLNSDSLEFGILTATEAGFYILREGFVCKKTSNTHLNSDLYPSQFMNWKWDKSDIAIQKVSIRKNKVIQNFTFQS